MRSSDHYYYSIEEEIKAYNLRMETISIIQKKFPDVAKMAFRDDPDKDNFMQGMFYSPAIVNDENLELDFHGKWYSFTVTPYVEVLCNNKKIKIYNSIPKINFWRDRFAIEVKENPEVRWDNGDELMLKLGYNQKIIKLVYDKILEKMAEHPITHKGYTVKLIRDGLPEYIKKYLILL